MLIERRAQQQQWYGEAANTTRRRNEHVIELGGCTGDGIPKRVKLLA